MTFVFVRVKMILEEYIYKSVGYGFGFRELLVRLGKNMIEAVNSALANATLLRGNTEQANSLRTEAPAGNIEQLSKVEFQLAPYVSPYVEVDTTFNKAVLKIRDRDTGDVKRQFPSETTMRARAAQAEIESQSIRNVISQGSEETSSASTSTQPRERILVDTSSSSSSSSSNARTAEAQVAAATFSAQALASSGQGASSVSFVA